MSGDRSPRRLGLHIGIVRIEKYAELGLVEILHVGSRRRASCGSRSSRRYYFLILEGFDFGVDVVPGRGGGFSLEAPEGVRFLSRGRAFTDAENAQLEATSVIIGADYARGKRPPARGAVVADVADACPYSRGARRRGHASGLRQK
jgi:Protein of unknown function (DUF779)